MSAPPVDRDITKLAPAFVGAVQHALSLCADAGMDAYVYEAMRTDELQRYYFATGASKAKDALHGWHHFGLAVDVISRSKGWAVTPAWRAAVTACFKRAGCDWGGDWHSFKDEPHYQLGGIPASPTDETREHFAAGGLPAVWALYSAS